MRRLGLCLLLFPLLLEGRVRVEGNASFYARALYWHPSHEGSPYVIVQVPTKPQKPVSIEPRSRFGYEVGGHVFSFGHHLSVGGGYLSYDTFAQATTLPADGTTLVPTFILLAAVQNAKARIDSQYRRADLLAGWTLVALDALRGQMFAGIRYFSAKEIECYRYDNTSPFVPSPALVGQDYSWRGWGPRVGAQVAWCPSLGDALHLRLLVEGAVMSAIANRRLTAEGALGVFLLGVPSLDYPRSRAINLAADMNISVGIDAWIGEVRLAGQVGYALDIYLNARQRFESMNTLRSPDRAISSMGYGGPFAGLGFYF